MALTGMSAAWTAPQQKVVNSAAHSKRILVMSAPPTCFSSPESDARSLKQVPTSSDRSTAPDVVALRALCVVWGTLGHRGPPQAALVVGALHELRRQGRIGDEAFHRIQEELDWSRLDAAPAGRFQSLFG